MKSLGKLFGIPKADIGVRGWWKYDEPFKFTIIVNDIADIKKHKGLQYDNAHNYGINSSLSGDRYRISI